jgi:hypothetical protein
MAARKEITPGHTLTAVSGVVASALVALERTGALDNKWTSAIIKNAAGQFRVSIHDPGELDAVLRSLHMFEGIVEVLRAMTVAADAPAREH